MEKTMRICWNTLESVRYNPKTKMFSKNGTTLVYKESCAVCKEPFLAYKSNPVKKFCGRSCGSLGEFNSAWKGGICSDKKEYQRKWYIKNRTKKLKQNKKWRETHKDRVKELGAWWVINNRAKVNLKRANRRALKVGATPKNADLKLIKWF